MPLLPVPTTETTVDCLIIGAGLTGLSAAFAAHNTFRLSPKTTGTSQRRTILVVEASNVVGGLVGTRLLNAEGEDVTEANLCEAKAETTKQAFDYLVELGPNSCQPTPRLLGLIFTLGIENEITTSDPSAPRFLLHKDKLMQLPMSLRAFLFDFSPISFASKLKAFAGVLGWGTSRKNSEDQQEESIGAFFDRITGDVHFRHCLIQPFMLGVYTGDALKLSGDVVLGGIAAEERAEGSIFASMLRGKKAKEGPLTMVYPSKKAEALSNHQNEKASEGRRGIASDHLAFSATRTPLETPETKHLIDAFCPEVTVSKAGIARGSLLSFRKGMRTLPQAIAQWLFAATKGNSNTASVADNRKEEGNGHHNNDAIECNRHVATEIRLSTTVTALAWNADERLWHVTLSKTPSTNTPTTAAAGGGGRIIAEDSVATTTIVVKARSVYSTLPAYEASKIFSPLIIAESQKQSRQQLAGNNNDGGNNATTSTLSCSDHNKLEVTRTAPERTPLDDIEYPSIAAVAIAVRASALRKSSPPCVAAAEWKAAKSINNAIEEAIVKINNNNGSSNENKEEGGGTSCPQANASSSSSSSSNIQRALESISNIRGFGQLLSDFNASMVEEGKVEEGDLRTPGNSGNGVATTQRKNKVIGIIYASSLFPINRTPKGREDRIAAAQRKTTTTTTTTTSSAQKVNHKTEQSNAEAEEKNHGGGEGEEEEAEELLLFFVGGARHASVAGMSEEALFEEAKMFLRHSDSIVDMAAAVDVADGADNSRHVATNPLSSSSPSPRPPKLRLLATKVWEKSIPQPNIGHQRRVREIVEAVARIPRRCHSTVSRNGNHNADDATRDDGNRGSCSSTKEEGEGERSIVIGGSWREGVAIGDCIHAGLRRGAELAHYVKTSSSSSSSSFMDANQLKDH